MNWSRSGNLRNARCDRRAFTLIELLVVIAIIAILASILVPVVSRALDRGRFMHCTGNISNMMKGSVMYANDNKGALPPANWGPTTTGWLYNGDEGMDHPSSLESGLIWDYIGVRSVYRCVADPQPGPDARHVPNRPQNSRMITSFCMNGSVQGYSPAPTHSNGLAVTFSLEEFRSNDVIFWEPDETKAGGWWWDGANRPDEGISARHFDSASVAVIDGAGMGMDLVTWYEMAPQNASARVPPNKNRLWNVPGSRTGN